MSRANIRLKLLVSPSDTIKNRVYQLDVNNGDHHSWEKRVLLSSSTCI